MAGAKPVGEPVKRDTERFRLLFTNSRPKIPAGLVAPVDSRSTREWIAARIAAKTPKAA